MSKAVFQRVGLRPGVFLAGCLLLGCASTDQQDLAARGSALVTGITSQVSAYSQTRDLLDGRRQRIADNRLASAQARSEVGLQTLRLLDVTQGTGRDRRLGRIYDEIIDSGDRYLAETAAVRERRSAAPMSTADPAFQELDGAARALANLAEPLAPGEALGLVQGLATGILSGIGSSEGSGDGQ